MDHLRDLEKWQATSHPLLADQKAAQLFSPDFAELYERLHHDIWERIFNLHGTIYTLEQLAEFPFDYLYGPNEMEFWWLIYRNFGEMAIIQLHSLVNDTGNDSHTIRSFKNQIVGGPWLLTNKCELLTETLRARKWDDEIESVTQRVRRIRNHRIAHRLLDRSTGQPKENLVGITLKELRSLFDAVHSSFGALSFGAGYSTLVGDLAPGTVGGKPTPTCLDLVLDAILRDSHFVNQPELRAEYWPVEREDMAPAKLQQLNDFRRRVGLPDA